MKRFVLAITLTCALSASTLAGEMHTTGAPEPVPGDAHTVGAPAPGDVSTTGTPAPGEMPISGLVMTMLDLLF